MRGLLNYLGSLGKVKNSAGGTVFAVERFLFPGSEGGAYYIDERTLTRENAESVALCLKEDGRRVVKTVVEISAASRAPHNDPALFVLAMAASPAFADGAANSAVPRLIREFIA